MTMLDWRTWQTNETVNELLDAMTIVPDLRARVVGAAQLRTALEHLTRYDRAAAVRRWAAR